MKQLIGLAFILAVLVPAPKIIQTASGLALSPKFQIQA
jgi:hypothetical protein